MPTEKIAVEKRTVYEFGKRRRVVYDARGELRGVRYAVTASSRREAVSLAFAEVGYVSTAGSFEAGGCAVVCNGFESWEFRLPGRCVMSYGAADLAAAVSYAAWSYREHPEAQAFRLAAANERCAELGLSPVDAQ